MEESKALIEMIKVSADLDDELAEQIALDAISILKKRFGYRRIDTSKLPSDVKDVLEVARAAVLDAAFCEDGLDGGAAQAVADWITDILGDTETFQFVVEGESDQSIKLYKKAFEHSKKSKPR